MTAARHVVIYSRSFYITCTAHALHNAAEQIRNHYEGVNNFIAAVKTSVIKIKIEEQNFQLSTVLRNLSSLNRAVS